MILCERGELDRGLVLMARSLELAEEAGDLPLQRASSAPASPIGSVP